MIIDCDGCAVRGDACGDCVVAVLLGAPPEITAAEQRAIDVLAEAGLVPPLRLVAVRDESRATPEPARSVTETTRCVTDDTSGTSTRVV